MHISVKLDALRQTHWFEYLLRFLFGGTVTVIAGLIADQFGPVVGGLFLAFPAIFPASVTLVERHETERKEQQGLDGNARGRHVAGVVAARAALGSIGLLAFAGTVWWLAARMASWQVLALATLIWFGVSSLVWIMRQRL